MSIHSNLSGKTSKFCDLEVYLKCPVEIDSFDIVPTTSIVSYLIFLQSLGVAISESNGFSLKKFKVNHPGGSIGNRLKNE